MSEMVRHRGIVKKLSTPENFMEVFEKLVDEGKINREQADIYDGKVEWIYEDEYEIIDGCLFDISDAQQEYGGDEEVAEAEKINDTDYRIHIYYYNGGDSPIDSAIKRADKEYKEKTTWRETADVMIRVELSRYDDTSKTYIYEGLVEDLLNGDDGGSRGFEAVLAKAAENPDGSGGDSKAWCIDKVEYKDIN